MREVIINSRVRYRGPSGTSSVVEEMERAFTSAENVAVTMRVGPRPVSGRGSFGRVLRLAQAVWWDGWASGRGMKSDVAIFPTGVGGWWSHAGRNILMVHDLMVLDKDLEFDPGFRISASITWPISIRFADIIVTPSEWTRTQLVSRWPRAEEKIVVVPYPSRLKARAGKPKQWDAHRRPTILMVSSTDPHKDHVRGIEVVQMARKISGIDFALAIIGPRGRAERKVEEWTNLCDPTQTWISRYVGLNDEQLTRHLDDGFALLNTSKAEGFGLPLLEAAARDLPVVHSRVASLNEVIDLGSDGFVTSLYLAYELTALLDAASYEAAVQRGREAVKAYSFERFADDLVSLIGRT